MYHEQTENIQPASKLRQIMILRNLAGRLKKQVESVERETKKPIHHGATASQTRTANGSAPHVAADSKQFLTTLMAPRQSRRAVCKRASLVGIRHWLYGRVRHLRQAGISDVPVSTDRPVPCRLPPMPNDNDMYE